MSYPTTGAIAVTFTGPMSDGYHVHKRGCRDLDKRARRGDATWSTTVWSRRDAVFAIYEDVMGDRYAEDEKIEHWEEYDDLRVFPCVTLPDGPYEDEES